eukprot:CAMPEP_0119055780 /NCGR_PEP_ID=MMETSP1178-20130426/331_1 /TAXON_ID=33656 /ORGANISM="unid sp, Strain CCMP2000" /LENGTH=128 /DNA_ID=CAMNT_0007036407 /DNA_START=217 /DNA_END=600 /DNA_ORIENTATION=+
MMTLSPRKNILLIKRSLLTGFDFLATPPLGVSVHISLTFSSTMLQCLSNAFTRPSNFLLYLQLMSTCVLLLTLCVSTDSGPVENSSSSVFALSSLPAAARRLIAADCEGGAQEPSHSAQKVPEEEEFS